MDVLLSAPRYKVLLDAAWSTDGIRVEDMAKTLGVSSSTIRRDLRRLENEHLLKGCVPGSV
jgi:DeoR/GlpR family transcriptional regulator of sugar metabolism